MRERFLTVDMLSKFHSRHSNRSMHVIRRRNDHRIDSVPQIGQQLTIIGKMRYARKRSVCFVKASRINVAETDKFHTGMRSDVAEIRPSHAVDANCCNV